MRHDEYLRLLLVASSVSPLLKLALIVAEGTGRRISACRKLIWRDVLFDEGAIRWRAENDKKGYEQVVVMSPDVHEELAARHVLVRPSPEALVFPGPRCPSEPCSRHLLDGWLRRAYGLAGLKPQPGGLWHPLRRKWATERKGYPLKDLAAAGGWRDEQTVLRSYQLSDADTVRQIVLYPTQRLNGEGAAGEKLTTRLTTPRHSRRRSHNGNRCRAFSSQVGTAGFTGAARPVASRVP